MRPGQLAFSAAVHKRFGGRCILSGLHEDFSVAAHIVGYTECETAHEQDDPDNGLFLPGHLHLAFDGHLFGIRADGTVVWSRRVDPAERERLGRLLRSAFASYQAARPIWSGGGRCSSKARGVDGAARYSISCGTTGITVTVYDYGDSLLNP